MGIPGFYGNWLAEYVAQAIINGLPPFVASLSFDLNGVFHDARKQVYDIVSNDPRVIQALADTDPQQLELELQNTIASIILRVVQAVKPRDCLILAVDGVAPGAKMQQQRGRRERAARDRAPSEIFDRNAITPGTEFMIRLDTFMVRFIGTYRQYLPPKVIYSSHLVPGEGEHKIMDFYRKGEVSDGPAAKQGGSHVLYGLDADLIMLSLLSPLEKIYLSRETVKEVVDISRLRQYLLDKSKRPSAIDDFVVMMFLIGNDFLPHMPALEEMSESINILLDKYSDGNYVLTRTDANGRHEINWDDMKRFIGSVATEEDNLLASLAVKPVKFPSRFLQASLIEGKFYPNIFRSTWYQNALGPKGPSQVTEALVQIINSYVPTEQDYLTNPEATQLQFTTISEVTTQRIEQMAVDYLRTMSWIYLYYREGTSAINQELAYLYYHTPMLIDLAAVVQTINVSRTISGYEAYNGMTVFTALHQLVAVLPLKSRELLPEELQPLFSYNSGIRDLLPDNFIIELDGKNKEDKGVPIVPLIDRNRIIDAVAQIPFTLNRVKLWVPADDQVFIRTEDEALTIARIQADQKHHAEFLLRQATKSQRGKERRFTQIPGQRSTRPQRPRQQGQPGQTRQPTQQAGVLPRQQTRTVQLPKQQTRTVQLPKQVTTTQPQPIQLGQQPLVPTMTATQTAKSPARSAGRATGIRSTRGIQRDIRRPPPTAQQPQVPQPQVPQPQVPQPQVPQPQVPQPQVPQPQRTQPIGRGAGPTLAPIGLNLPPGLQVGRGTTRTIPTVAPPKPQAQSPAQWKQLPNLI